MPTILQIARVGFKQKQVPLGKMTPYYVCLPAETPSPYKQDYHYSTIRVREGSRGPSEMTDENMGLWENKREEKRVCEWKREWWSRWTLIHLVPADGYMSGGLGLAVSRCDGWEISSEKHVDLNDSHASCTQRVPNCEWTQLWEALMLNNLATCRSYAVKTYN